MSSRKIAIFRGRGIWELYRPIEMPAIVIRQALNDCFVYTSKTQVKFRP